MRTPNCELSPDGAMQAWESASRTDGVRPLTATLELITPMYGGGVQPGEIDRELPVRPSAVRGQLRYWWRLLNARPSTKQLFEAESELWGGIRKSGPRASRVSVGARAEPATQRELVKWGAKFPSYALVLDSRAEPELLRPGYRFGLEVSFCPSVTPQQRAQVVEAVRWWASFAGLGARTRRGLGAVRVVESAGDLMPVERSDVESRGGRLVLRTSSAKTEAVGAWAEAVRALEQFRQGVGVGRRQGKGRGKVPGASNWPEASTLRRLSRGPGSGSAGMEFFPRASFGLPIVFQFKGEMSDLTLKPEGRDRMASPLVLRPYFDGKAYKPAALLVPGWEACVSRSVELKGCPHFYESWPKDSADRKREARRIPPLDDQGEADALSAFVTYFEQ